MDNQIKNLCQVCERNIVLGLGPTKKWMCGECIIKYDNFIKEERRKHFEIFEEKIRNGMDTSTNTTTSS